MSELTSKNIFLSSHSKGQNFDESLAKFVTKATKLTQQKVTEDELLDFQQELGEVYSEAVGWLYFTRRERDKALGTAFMEYPKKLFNSEEQIALARAKASSQIRIHELVKELMEAIKFRKQVNGQKLEDRKMER